MKFLLTALNAKYIHSNPAIYSLRAYCIQEQPELKQQIELAEYTINQTKGWILSDIYRRKPDVIGFSCYIWNWDMIRELVCELAKVRPDLPIWLGGPEVSYNPEEILKQMPFLSGIMVGEGEETFLELMKFYSDEADSAKNGREAGQTVDMLGRIHGIVYRTSGGNVKGTGPRGLTDISQLPFFYLDQELADFADRIIYYESSRGCPYRCSYCLSSIDKTVRLRDLNLVKSELQFFLERKVPQVKFVDRTFNCNHTHAMEIWKYIRDHDNGITNFHFEIAADILTEEELELLGTMRPGLVQLEIGVQSTNADTLREIRRGMNWEHLKSVVTHLQKANNIHIHLDLIAGLPYEDLNSFRNSFNDVYSCRPEQLQLGFLKVLKGSYMCEMAEKYGVVYTDHPPYEVLFSNWISYDDILLLKRVEEMVELFYNSAQFVHTLPFLETCFDTPFEMFEKLAEYMEEQGLVIQSPSRLHRYQMLLGFAVLMDPEREQWYRELLTLDLYLRENMKTRPEFAPRLAEDAELKKKPVRFYQNEMENPTVLQEYVESGYDSRQMARMTHVEYFTLPVWNGKQGYVLFDYQRRNPLNREAFTVLLDL